VSYDITLKKKKEVCDEFCERKKSALSQMDGRGEKARSSIGKHREHALKQIGNKEIKFY
jgi:hypothetical protein